MVIEFILLNQGWSDQIFVYELLDASGGLLHTNQINISAYNFETINIPISDPLIENYVLKVFSKSNIDNYQSLIFDNEFMLGDTNGDNEIDVLDIIVLINIILNDEDLLEQGDLNYDNGINILDIALLINWIVESID